MEERDRQRQRQRQDDITPPSTFSSLSTFTNFIRSTASVLKRDGSDDSGFESLRSNPASFQFSDSSGSGLGLYSNVSGGVLTPATTIADDLVEAGDIEGEEQPGDENGAYWVEDGEGEEGEEEKEWTVHPSFGVSLTGKRILSFDGGGVRGLSSVVILQNLQTAMFYHGFPRDVLVADVFDIICGTSTGGLIALMLGRLRMSISECLKAYEELASEIFTYQFPRRLGRWVRGGKQYNAKILEEKVKKIVKGKLGDENALLYDPGSNTHVFVTADLTSSPFESEPILFRSYDLGIGDISTTRCTIWEAARATTAAPCYFKHVEIDDVKYVDAGLHHNNPVKLAMFEAKALSSHPHPDSHSHAHPHHSQIPDINAVISIGTGLRRSKRRGPNDWREESRMCGSGYEAHLWMVENYGEGSSSSTSPPVTNPNGNVYVRLNANRAVGEIDLAAARESKRIRRKTEKYVVSSEAREEMARAARMLVDGWRARGGS